MITGFDLGWTKISRGNKTDETTIPTYQKNSQACVNLSISKGWKKKYTRQEIKDTEQCTDLDCYKM